MIFVHMCKEIYWFVMYVNDCQQLASKWIGSPCTVSLDMPSLGSSRCPIWEYGHF
jgi:hypothetical protein